MKGAFDGIQDIKRDEVFDKKRKKALDLHQELFHPKPKFYGEDGREILLYYIINHIIMFI